MCGDRDVVLDAQTPLAAWYESFGFEVTGAEFLDDGIPHLPMRLTRGLKTIPSGVTVRGHLTAGHQQLEVRLGLHRGQGRG